MNEPFDLDLHFNLQLLFSSSILELSCLFIPISKNQTASSIQLYFQDRRCDSENHPPQVLSLHGPDSGASPQHHHGLRQGDGDGGRHHGGVQPPARAATESQLAVRQDGGGNRQVHGRPAQEDRQRLLPAKAESSRVNQSLSSNVI